MASLSPLPEPALAPAPAPAAASAPASVSAAKSRAYPLMSRRDVENLIAQGRHLIIVNQHVLKVDGWVRYHPGGDKAIQHMVGRDATDEVDALHSAEARTMMDKYRIGRIEGRWHNFIPPIQGGRFRRIDDDPDNSDTDLHDSILHEGSSAPSLPSSDPSTRAASPVFDLPPSPYDAKADTSVRQRRNLRGSAAGRSESVSSASSVSAASEMLPLDGMTYLNSETRKKISLDLDQYPPLDGATQLDIQQKYRLLNERIKSEGLYACNYSAYAIECTRYSLLFGGMLYCLSKGWWAVAGILLGCFWHQLVFTAHDAGHMGITHDFQTDTMIGIFIADFLGGLSLGWWKRSHNVHHIVTNSPEHDPDIEHMPFFAVSHRLLQSLYSTYHEKIMSYDAFAKVLLSVQHYTYYPILLFGRFNLYVQSWIFLICGLGPRNGPARWHRWIEVAGQVVFWTWFGYGILYKTIDSNMGRFSFVMLSHMVTMPLHVQITLSHFAMSTADLGPSESFPQRMLRTTMDVDCPQWLDFFHGGLQFQAIHHLYPRIPRHNLRRTQKLVQQFCDDVGIPYALYGFLDGNKQVIGRLAEVSRQAAILAKCQSVVASSENPLGYGH